MKSSFAALVLATCLVIGSSKVSWHRELSDAREIAMGRMLGAVSPSPSASGSVSPSPSPSPSPSSSGSPSRGASPTATGSAAASPSIAATVSRTETRSPSPSPTNSLPAGISPSASPLPPVLIKIVQSVSIFSVDQLNANPAVVRKLLKAFKQFASRSTDRILETKVVAILDALTRESSPVPLDHPFNQEMDDRRRLVTVANGGAGILYQMVVPPVSVVGDTHGSQTQSEQVAAATQALVQMHLDDDQGGFNDIMVPLIVAEAEALGINTTGLVTVLGWSEAEIEVPTNPYAATTTKRYPTAAIIGVILGTIGGVIVVASLMWAAGVCRRKKQEEEQRPVEEWRGGNAPSAVADPAEIVLAETVVTSGGNQVQVVTLSPGEPIQLIQSRV